MGLRLKKNLTIKFIGYLIFLTVIPLLVVGLISLRVSTEILTEESRVFTIEVVKEQREYLDLQLEQVESLIANISGVDVARVATVEKTLLGEYIGSLSKKHVEQILAGIEFLQKITGDHQ